jgi:ornithine carbamoyltransferase
MKHLISLFDLTKNDVDEILKIAFDIKKLHQKGERPSHLQNRLLTQIFDKPSLRTRTSFEASMVQLGGSSAFMTSAEAGLQGRESLPDVSRVLSSYSDAIVIRTFSHELIENFAKYSTSPVINGLSDDKHPCQALTDLFTMIELFGPLKDQHLVYIGDGNNVAASLVIICTMYDLPVTICTPPGYELDPKFLKEFEGHYSKSKLNVTHDVNEAVKNADVIYTDVWASMGQEEEKEKRAKIFAPYQINKKLMEAAPSDCRFLHCLPARRDLEVTDDVMESNQSDVFLQAENRMHLAKGVLTWLINHNK